MTEDDATLGQLLRTARDRLPPGWQVNIALFSEATGVFLYDPAHRLVRVRQEGEGGEGLARIILDAVNTARNAEGLGTIDARGEIRVELN